MSEVSKVRVRFAPSPTGFLHIGGLRTALYNYLFARHHGGAFILRIEDTDQTRVVSGGLENILQTLEWAGLTWDEGLIHQSQRLDLYRKYADELVEKGSAYYCFCPPERLEEVRKIQMAQKEPPMYNRHCREVSPATVQTELAKGTSYVIRFRVPLEGETVVQDVIHGEVLFENKLIDDQVLLKSDGYPTYHLANVVDDHLMEITHVIRGDEWLPSTPKHVLLYEALGWQLPAFAHLPLLLNPDRSKLSKRAHDVAVLDYQKHGYLPQALLNFVALLGWNPRADQEIYTLETLVKEFALEKVNKSGAVVNFQKLKWLNSEYIKKMSLEDLTRAVLPWFLEVELIKEEKPDTYVAPRLGEAVSWKYLLGVVELARDRLLVLGDAPSQSEFFFVRVPVYDATLLVWKKMSRDDLVTHLERVQAALEVVHEEEWHKEQLERILKDLISQEELGVGETLWPMRVALTGREASPGPFEVAAALGKALTLERLQAADLKARSEL